MFDVAFIAPAYILGLKPQAGSSRLYAVLQQGARRSEKIEPITNKPSARWQPGALERSILNNQGHLRAGVHADQYGGGPSGTCPWEPRRHAARQASRVVPGCEREGTG